MEDLIAFATLAWEHREHIAASVVAAVAALNGAVMALRGAVGMLRKGAAVAESFAIKTAPRGDDALVARFVGILDGSAAVLDAIAHGLGVVESFIPRAKFTRGTRPTPRVSSRPPAL